MPVDISEAEVPARVAVGEVLVIDSHEVENGRVEVVDVDFVLHGGEAKFVGGAVGHASFDSPSGKPN